MSLVSLRNFVFVLAALFALAMPSAVRAHEGHAHGAPTMQAAPQVHAHQAHAGRPAVRLMNTAALLGLASDTSDMPETVASAHKSDDHDCAERGCGTCSACGACASLLSSLVPELWSLRISGQLATTDEISSRGFAVPYDGPPPKTFA